MLQKLENYIEVGILEEIPMNTYIRYLTLVNNRITLRFGGFLKKHDFSEFPLISLIPIGFY